ncbi:TrkH family potassium uptake protein [Anaeromicropila populeti]|uniref:Trk system potassium uptake protein TrkH n=1 Tax=Anaeromicropila populeti TaxID=37658 RepID=A0A1I6JZK9_9FIRM|nr:potassium transporter TrkG [Anaeromicropila populeti]SFR84393.1 trk system potassium uptake protein TrkH [Anaeromicropila populeti]
MFRVKKSIFTTTQTIAIGFFVAILAGTILLMLPISSNSGQGTNLVDAMFTTTTAICVTGLTTVVTADHWSVFGKIIIAILMEFGGLGVVTFTTSMFLIMGKRITLKDRLLIQDAYNLDTLRGLVKLTMRVMKGTVIVQLAGALLYSFQFIPEHGLIKGIAVSVFTSISAFCNAGIDLVGPSSFVPYCRNVLINVVTMALIVIGGIGFPVWWDVIRIFKMKEKDKIGIRGILRKFQLHSKLALCITAILILTGTVFILIFEWNNPNTIGRFPWWEKGMAAMFQSVTTRTAGFLTIPQENFTNSSNLLFMLLMFVGGSPSGTAGGVKTVTVGILLLTAMSIIRGKEDTEIFHRKIRAEYIRKALAVVIIFIGWLMLSTMLLLIVEKADFLDTLFEATSAIATVGLTRGLTGRLSTLGKLIIIATMYIGRVGPITMMLTFNVKKSKPKMVRLPEERIIVG